MVLPFRFIKIFSECSAIWCNDNLLAFHLTLPSIAVPKVPVKTTNGHKLHKFMHITFVIDFLECHVHVVEEVTTDERKRKYWYYLHFVR